MTEAQKYQRKRNILIIVFMFLLVVFVCVMCFIFIQSKINPLPKFISPDEIEIKQMNTLDYNNVENPAYVIINESNNFVVNENEQELNLILNSSNQVNVSRDGIEEDIQIISNDVNINDNIKIVYQDQKNSLILTNEGNLFKINDATLIDNKLNAEQILVDNKVKDIVKLVASTSDSYILDYSNRVINVNTNEQYTGIIDVIQTATSTIYVYEDFRFGLEQGKYFVDEYYQPIRINLSFDNKIIGENNVVYEIDSNSNTILTSNIGVFNKVGYSKPDDSDIYTINVLSNTGSHDLNSNYYYTR